MSNIYEIIEVMKEILDPSRPNLCDIFVCNGNTYATNGHIMIKLFGVHSDISSHIDFEEHFERGVQGSNDWVDVEANHAAIDVKCDNCKGTGKVLGSVECPECDGKGEIELETDYNTYCVDCKTCCGKGEIEPEDEDDKKEKDCPKCDGSGVSASYIEYGMLDIDAKYYNLISKLPNAKIRPFGYWKCYSTEFKFDGGCGILMGRRKTY